MKYTNYLEKTSRSNNYYLYLLTSFAIFCILISYPMVLRFIIEIFDIPRLTFNGLTKIYSLTQLSTGKKHSFAIISLIITIINLFIFLKNISKRTFIKKTGFFILIIFLHIVSLLWVKNASNHNFNNTSLEFNSLVFQNYPGIDYEEMFSKKHMLKAKITNPQELYDFSKKRYMKNEKYLITKWNENSKEKLISVFYINLVSRMWFYGMSDPNKDGCVLYNSEKITLRKNRTIRTYIDSEIGCCTDYTVILKFLLDKEKITNRVVTVSGHVFNEIKIDNQWHTADANNSMIFLGSWKNIIYRKPNEKVYVTLFPNINLVKKHKNYRPYITKSVIDMLYWSIMRTTKMIKYPTEGRALIEDILPTK